MSELPRPGVAATLASGARRPAPAGSLLLSAVSATLFEPAAFRLLLPGGGRAHRVRPRVVSSALRVGAVMWLCKLSSLRYVCSMFCQRAIDYRVHTSITNPKCFV